MYAECKLPSSQVRSQLQACRSPGGGRSCSRLEIEVGVEAAVAHYLARHRARAARELDYFSRVVRSDAEAVSRAALAQLPSGKRHPHQYRIPKRALEESRQVLLANLPALRQATSFDELIALVGALTEPIPGIGQLAVYDTTLRIGARFGLEPSRVYLHAGTRDGARALGFDGRRANIDMVELPEPLQRLSAREAEDLLCIYKDSLN